MTELSLLWPDGRPTPTWTISPESIRDLELEAVVQAMCSHSSQRDAVRAVVFSLCQEKETIRYRQVVLADLQVHPPLAERFEQLLAPLSELTQFSYRKIGKASQLQEVIARARELELLVEIVQQLHEAFAAVSSPLQSTGLQALRDKISSLIGDRLCR